MAARPGPDLAAHGYAETEYVVRGRAASYRGETPDRRSVGPRRRRRGGVRDPVRHPACRSPRTRSAARSSSSGSTSAAAATPRRTGPTSPTRSCGRATCGSASRRSTSASRAARRRSATWDCSRSRPTRATSCSTHPGDSFSYGIFTAVADAFDGAGPLIDLDVEVDPGGGGVAVGVRPDLLRQRRAPPERGLRRLPRPLARWRRDAAGGAGTAGRHRRVPHRPGDRHPRRPRRARDHGADRDRPDRPAAVPPGPSARLRADPALGGGGHRARRQVPDRGVRGVPRLPATGQHRPAGVRRPRRAAAPRHLGAWRRRRHRRSPG